MKALICDCCNSMFVTENEATLCELCVELAKLKSDREFLVSYVDKLLDDSRKFIMEHIGNSENYHYHLGQAAALQDIKNILFIQNN